MIQDDEGEQNTSITIMLLEVPFLIHMIDSKYHEGDTADGDSNR